jgi:membrane fusion protein
MASLFRPEVIEGRQQAWLGSIQLVRPVPLAVLTLLVVTIAVLVGVFLVEGRYTRKAHITGYLVPDRGVLRLVPPQPGVVVETRVAEGGNVKRGDVLFVLSVDRSSVNGDTQVAVQQSLAARRSSLQDAARRTTQLQQEQAAALDRQISDMRQEQAQLDAEAEVVRQQLALKEQDLAQYESLMTTENFVSPAHLRTKKAEVLEGARQAAGAGAQARDARARAGRARGQAPRAAAADAGRQRQIERSWRRWRRPRRRTRPSAAW